LIADIVRKFDLLTGLSLLSFEWLELCHTNEEGQVISIPIPRPRSVHRYYWSKRKIHWVTSTCLVRITEWAIRNTINQNFFFKIVLFSTQMVSDD
jgi:hypothetical protein